MIKQIVLASALIAMPAIASAQDADLAAARKALTATEATTSFDNILIDAATGLKNQLTAANPDKADLISTIVDEEAIALAARRGALESEAARLFGNTFTPAELTAIHEFFSSETGQKYLRETPVLARELNKVARVWASGISRDLRANVGDKLRAAVGSEGDGAATTGN